MSIIGIVTQSLLAYYTYTSLNYLYITMVVIIINVNWHNQMIKFWK